MKVAFVIPSLSGGGAEYVALQWAQHLRKAGDEVTVLLTHTEPNAAQGEIPCKRLGSRSGFLRVTLALRAELKAERPDAVVALMPFSNLVALFASRLMKKKERPLTVISEHNLHSGLAPLMGFGFKVQLALARVFYRMTDACVAVSHAVAAEIASSCAVPVPRIWVIPNPAAEVAGTANPRRSSVQNLPTLSLVVPARLVDQKRPELAIETARLAADLVSREVRVHFFGTGPLESKLRREAISLGVDAEFHGWVDRWYEHVPPDGVVLLPSGVEGFGNVLIESAARSIPVVVSSRALGAADACIPSLTGVLVAGNEPIDYVNGVKQAMQIEMPDVSSWLRRFTGESSGEQLRSAILRSVRAT